MKVNRQLFVPLALAILLSPRLAFSQKVGYPQQCADSATNPTTAQWITCTEARAGTSALNPIYTTPAGAIGSQTQWYTGSAWQSWVGRTSGADNVSNTTAAPYVYNLQLAFDGTAWDRVRVSTLGDALGATPAGQNVASFNAFYDGTNFRRWAGETWDTTVNQITVAPSVLSLNTFYNTTTSTGYRWTGSALTDNMDAPAGVPGVGSFLMVWDGSKWDRWSGGPSSVTLGDAMGATPTGAPSASYSTFYNGTNFQRWTGSALTDDMDAPTAVPGVGSYLMVWDGAKWDRWSGGPSSVTLGDAMGATPTGAPSASYSTFYDGTNFRRWAGEAWDTTVDVVTTAPSVLSLGTFYNADVSKGYRWVGETWDTDMSGTASPNVNSRGSFYDVSGSKISRWQGENWDTAIDGVTTAPSTISLGTFYDAGTSKGYRWNGTTPADNLGTAMVAPYVLSLGSFYDGTNYRRWAGETYDSSLATTVAPVTIGLTAFYNGAASQYWLGGSLTSSIGAPVNGPYVGAIMYGYSSSGPTYYPIKADANGSYVHMADLLPGEDSVNDWRKVRVESVAVYTPSYTDTASVDSTGTTEVLASVEILGYSNISITLKNTGATNDIDNTYLYVSPNGSDWVLLNTESTNVAPGGTSRVFTISENSERYLKILAAAEAATTTSTRVWLTARVTD